MKKIVATRLVLIIGTVMGVISLLNILIQRDDSIKHMKNNSALVIDQIDVALKKNEQEIVKKTEVRNLISRMPVSDGMTYYVVEKKEHTIVGATDNSLVTTPIEELMGEWKLEEVVTSSKTGLKKCFYFEEVGEYYIGVSQLESMVFENLKSNAGQLFIYLFIASYIMIVGSMNMVDRYIIQDIDKITAGMKDITNDKLDTVIKADNTPELEGLSVNINQMTSSLMEQNRKIFKVLNAVDMLIAVYEYGGESDRVLASGKLGAILMMSEEEMEKLLEKLDVLEKVKSAVCLKLVGGEVIVGKTCNVCEHVLTVNTLELKVMDSHDSADTAKEEVSLEAVVKVNGYKTCLPVVTVNDVRTEI